MSDFTDFDFFELTGANDIEYRLTKPLVWRIGHEFGPEYIVPEGFVVEVSIPKLVDVLFGSWLRGIFGWKMDYHDRCYLKMAALHDHMLEHGYCAPEMMEAAREAGCSAFTYSRAEAAGTAGAVLKACGVGRFERFCAVIGMLVWTWR